VRGVALPAAQFSLEDAAAGLQDPSALSRRYPPHPVPLRARLAVPRRSRFSRNPFDSPSPAAKWALVCPIVAVLRFFPLRRWSFVSGAAPPCQDPFTGGGGRGPRTSSAETIDEPGFTGRSMKSRLYSAGWISGPPAVLRSDQPTRASWFVRRLASISRPACPRTFMCARPMAWAGRL